MKGQSLIVIAVIVCLVTMNSAEPSPEILHKGAEVAQIIMEMAKTTKTSMVGDGASGVGRSVADQLNELCGLGAAALAVCALTNPLCEAAGAFCAGLVTGTWIREHIG